ncbi:MAG: hypothetical protein HPZ91_18505 [Lentisphaeria bacterium]|nr:hypothetical protein [Lentisphaeria bacterium]
MERILVIGCCGAGKSVLSRALGKKLGLPVIHLDRLFWLPGWVGQTCGAFDAALETELAKERWIMDGNFGRTLARRLEFADTVIFLRYSRLCCVAGVFRRRIRYFGRSRPDLGEGCPEKIDRQFLRFVWNYNRVTLPVMEERLASRPAGCRLVELKSRREARKFLEKL